VSLAEVKLKLNFHQSRHSSCVIESGKEAIAYACSVYVFVLKRDSNGVSFAVYHSIIACVYLFFSAHSCYGSDFIHPADPFHSFPCPYFRRF